MVICTTCFGGEAACLASHWSQGVKQVVLVLVYVDEDVRERKRRQWDERIERYICESSVPNSLLVLF